MTIEKQFMTLISTNYVYVYRVINDYCDDPEEKRDLQQTVLENAWKAYPSFRGDSAFGTWLHSIAVHAALNERRKARTRRAAVERYEVYMNKATPDMRVWENPFKKGFRLLNDLNQDLIILYYIKELSANRVAKLLAISPNNVRVRAFNSINNIRKQTP